MWSAEPGLSSRPHDPLRGSTHSQKAPHLAECPAVTISNFLVILNQEAPFSSSPGSCLWPPASTPQGQAEFISNQEWSKVGPRRFSSDGQRGWFRPCQVCTYFLENTTVMPCEIPPLTQLGSHSYTFYLFIFSCVLFFFFLNFSFYIGIQSIK